MNENGIMFTGDTLYSTKEELIDWYPGDSDVSAMAKAVTDIRDTYKYILRCVVLLL